jgi:hypothetical protein
MRAAAVFDTSDFETMVRKLETLKPETGNLKPET